MSEIAFTYADPNFSRRRRLLIRSIETITGQPRLKRLYLDYRRNPVPGESFFAAAIRKLQLDVRYDAARLEGIPQTGPCVVVANHPYGVLDGLSIGWLVSQRRSDFVILTNASLLHAPETQDYLLPVDFSGTPEAMEINLKTRAAARERLERGGCIIVFPAGGVSTSADPLGLKPAFDAPWQPFTVQLAQRARATIVPMFFAGQNSRLFQIASHLNQTLRLSLIFKEVSDRIGTRLNVAIGEPIDGSRFAEASDRRAIAMELMRQTYALAATLPEDRAARRICRRPFQPVDFPQPKVCAPRL